MVVFGMYFLMVLNIPSLSGLLYFVRERVVHLCEELGSQTSGWPLITNYVKIMLYSEMPSDI